MEEEKPFTMSLPSGAEHTFNNPNPATIEVVVTTVSGSLISFTLPAGGSFKIKSMGDIKVIDQRVVSVAPYGPRSIDQD